MEDQEELKGKFDVEICMRTGEACIRYYGSINIAESSEFSEIFWVGDGLGAFSSFSGRLFSEEDGTFRAILDSAGSAGDYNMCGTPMDLKQVRCNKEKNEYELCDVNGSRTTLVVTRVCSEYDANT